MERGQVEEKRDRDRVALKRKATLILGHVLNSRTTLILKGILD